MTNYPLKFAVKSTATSGIQSGWISTAQSFEHEIPMSIPPEFAGPGVGLSPEDLFAMALQNCFIATFKVFAEKSKLHFDSLVADSVLEVDLNDKGRPWMARIHLQVTLKGAGDEENARRILEKASQNCMVLNSVKTEKSFHFELAP